MKKIPIVLLAVMPYVFTVTLFLDDSVSFKSAIGVVFALVIIFNMIYAFKLPNLGYKWEKLLFWNMLFKLCNIPIFLMVFFGVMLLHILILPLIPVLVLFDYLLLLPSSMYGISGLLCCYKDGKIVLKELIINIGSQFIFCLDVFSAVYCYFKFVKKDKKSHANEETVIKGLEPEVSIDPEAMEIFINSSKDKFAELYYRNGAYTYTIEEKHFDEYEGKIYYYWTPIYTASFFDTKEKAVEEIMFLIEHRGSLNEKNQRFQ